MSEEAKSRAEGGSVEAELSGHVTSKGTHIHAGLGKLVRGCTCDRNFGSTSQSESDVTMQLQQIIKLSVPFTQMCKYPNVRVHLGTSRATDKRRGAIQDI